MLNRVVGVVAFVLVLSGCKGGPVYLAADLGAFYRNPGNIEVTFRVTDAGGNAPDLKGVDIQKSLQILENGENLSTEGAEASLAAARNVKLKTLLLLDLSGSVAGSSLAYLKEAASQFVQTALNDSQVEIAIVTFDGSEAITRIVPFTNDPSMLLAAIGKLQPGVDRSTNLYGALVQSQAHLSGTSGSQGDIVKKALVVFTDGKDRAGRVSETDARAAVWTSLRSFAKVSAVVVGSEVDRNFLTSFEGNVLNVDDYKLLAKNFKALSHSLALLSRSYYTARICTPKRKGVHYIQLSPAGVVSGGHVEFNAAGFVPGCDVLNDSQWNLGSSNSMDSTVLRDSEKADSSRFFGRFSYTENTVVFYREAANPPANPDGAHLIRDYSGFSAGSDVACNLVFSGGAPGIVAGEELPIVFYRSFKNAYLDTRQEFQGFAFQLEKEGYSYVLWCRPLGAIFKQATKNSSSAADSEEYLLENLLIRNIKQ